VITYTHDGRVWRGDDGSAHEVLRFRAADMPSGTTIRSIYWTWLAQLDVWIQQEWPRGEQPTLRFSATDGYYEEGDTVTVRKP